MALLALLKLALQTIDRSLRLGRPHIFQECDEQFGGGISDSGSRLGIIAAIFYLENISVLVRFQSKAFDDVFDCLGERIILQQSTVLYNRPRILGIFLNVIVKILHRRNDSRKYS